MPLGTLLRTLGATDSPGRQAPGLADTGAGQPGQGRLPAGEQQLERAGYVHRVPDPRDARARLVQIAERGRAAVEIARQTEAAVEAEWIRHLGQASTAQLRRSLTRLREIADPYQ